VTAASSAALSSCFTALVSVVSLLDHSPMRNARGWNKRAMNPVRGPKRASMRHLRCDRERSVRDKAVPLRVCDVFTNAYGHTVRQRIARDHRFAEHARAGIANSPSGEQHAD
jgi:hypothetical protein